MKMSCNGCRVLRKACTQDCSLKPCLQWIRAPQSQAHATLFLAKFYGRAGLINLINAAPIHIRPACGRIINPVYGSVGLMCSGNWPRCQAAVEAVLRGAPLIKQVTGGDDVSSTAVPLQRCEIRHLSAAGVRSRNRFNRTANRRVDSVAAAEFLVEAEEPKFTITGWDCGEDEMKRAPSHDSFSVETVEPALVNRDEQPVRVVEPKPAELELTLCLDPTTIYN